MAVLTPKWKSKTLKWVKKTFVPVFKKPNCCFKRS